jgi:hypothetical protein
MLASQMVAAMAQLRRNAHPYDLTCSLALLNLGGRQQLMLVPCTAAAGDEGSSRQWSCVDSRSLYKKTIK